MAFCLTVVLCAGSNDLWVEECPYWRMARFRRKHCVTLIALVFLVLVVTLVLKGLPPEDSLQNDHFGAAVFLGGENKMEKDSIKKREQIKMSNSAKSDNDAHLEAALRMYPPPNYYVHAFYYAWYGNPKFDGKYIHWNHLQLPHWDAKVAERYPQGRHSPPDNIGANFYPSLGPYSSRDPAVIEAHMQQLRTAAIGKDYGMINPVQEIVME